MKRPTLILMIILCLLSFWLCMEVFISSIHPTKQSKENSKSFVIDSIDYHPSGRDNTLQVSPYWKCYLKGTNVWVRVNENREVGDSLSMIIRY